MLYLKILFAKIIRHVKKTFHVFNFFDNFIDDEIKEILQSTRDYYRNAEIHLGYLNRASDSFCIVWKFQFLIGQLIDVFQR